MKLESEKNIVIFKGLGKVFTVGGDVKQIASFPLEELKTGYKNSNRISDIISNYKIPYVAFMDGVAMGGATYFSLPGRYCVVTERTVYAMPETAIGYFNDAGSSFFLSKLKNNLGFYLGLTGARLKGFDLKKAGLATHYIESGKLDDVEEKLIVCKTHVDVAKTLGAFSSEPSSKETELDSIIPRIDKCFGGATVEEIYENLQRDGSDWALKTVKILDKMSPTSLKVTHKNLMLGRTSSLRDCLKREWLLVIQHVINSDMKEGCRALLIDKDFKPKWNPPSIKDVTAAHVDRFFQPSPAGDELTFDDCLPSKL